MVHFLRLIILVIILLFPGIEASAEEHQYNLKAMPDTTSFVQLRRHSSKLERVSLYEMPYSMTESSPDWKRLWINAGIFVGAYSATLAVLECLPEGSTNWNRTELDSTPWYKRWERNVLKLGPEWDGDDFIFNYVLHPYAGAVYFMGARSAGCNFYQSLLFSTLISTVGWEFGIEACMERPSIQDIFITPLVGSVVGESFYHAKRYLVANDYELLGSTFLGRFVGFVIDPVNEIVDLFYPSTVAHNIHARERGVGASLNPTIGSGGFALTLRGCF